MTCVLSGEHCVMTCVVRWTLCHDLCVVRWTLCHAWPVYCKVNTVSCMTCVLQIHTVWWKLLVIHSVALSCGIAAILLNVFIECINGRLVCQSICWKWEQAAFFSIQCGLFFLIFCCWRYLFDFLWVVSCSYLNQSSQLSWEKPPSIILTLFVPSDSEWVASTSPSNIGAERSKVGVGQEKPDQNAHISTVNTAVLPSLSDTVSLSSSPIYSESRTHPSSKSSTLCSLS